MTNQVSDAIRAAVRELDWSTAVLTEKAAISAETATAIMQGAGDDLGSYQKILTALTRALGDRYIFEPLCDLAEATIGELETELTEIMTPAEFDPRFVHPPSMTGLYSKDRLDPSTLARLLADKWSDRTASRVMFSPLPERCQCAYSE